MNLNEMLAEIGTLRAQLAESRADLDVERRALRLGALKLTNARDRADRNDAEATRWRDRLADEAKGFV